jgi:hypothetical protein
VNSAGQFLLHASDGILTAADSNTFTVSTGAATHLVINNLAAFDYLGSPISPTVTVSIEDAENNVITSNVSPITLKIATGPKSGKLNGTVTVVPQNGVATFTGISLSAAGTYTLQASANAGTLTSTPSAAIVAALPPNKLVFQQQPTTTVAGHAVAPSITVLVEDSAGHLVPFDNSMVTLTASTKPAGANVTGTLTVQAVNGVATFAGISATIAGNYVLTGTDSALKVVKSKSFTITPDATSAHLVLTTPSSPTLVGKTLAPAVVVKVEDQYGNIVTTDHSTVTLSAITGPGGTLTGTTTLITNKGVATFNKVVAAEAGSYTLAAADASLPIVTPVSFSQTILQGVTTLAAPKSASSTFGQTINLSAMFKSTAPTAVPFTGTANVVDQNNHVLGTASLAANGSIKFALTGVAPGSYTCNIVYAGDANHTAVTSSNFTLLVKQAATKTTLHTSAATITTGTSLTLTAAVTATPAQARTGNIVFKEGANILATISLDQNSTAAFTFTPVGAGTHTYVATYVGDVDFLTSDSVASKVKLVS